MSKVYQIITDQIVEKLKEGTVPWKRQWGGETAWPRNLASGKRYRGINVLLLGIQGFADPWWLTFKQAKALGGNVRKGEKGSIIVFWKQWEREDKDTGNIERLPVLRYYNGFHISQCEGIPTDKIPATETPDNPFSPIERCERIVNGYRGRPSISHNYGRAFYRPGHDLVGMPRQTAFDSPDAYYDTLFHELAHSTGHKDRLGRKGIEDIGFYASETYGREELIAEMGSAFLCGHAGIETATIDNQAAYVNGWLRVIRKDAKLVVQAAAAAQKAADHILGIKWDDSGKRGV